MSWRRYGRALLILGALGLQGCAGIGLALFGVGAGISGGTGVNYTLDSVAYKTFAESEPDLRAATLRTLKRLAMDVTTSKKTEAGSEIPATAGDPTVEVEIARLTPETSRRWGAGKKNSSPTPRVSAGAVVAPT